METNTINREVVMNENEVIKEFANHSSRLGDRVTLYKELDRLNQRACTGVYSDPEFNILRMGIVISSLRKYFSENSRFIDKEIVSFLEAWSDNEAVKPTNPPNSDLIDLCKGILNDNYVIGGTNINELEPIDSLIFIKEEVPKLVDHWIYLDHFSKGMQIATYILKNGKEIKSKPVTTYTGHPSHHLLYKCTDSATSIDFYLFLEGIESEGNLLLMSIEDFNIFKSLVGGVN